MAPRRCSPIAAAVLAFSIGAQATPAQKPATGQTATRQTSQPNPIRQFTAPDGSRFVLMPDERVSQVHWVVATWADGRDDPPNLEGLAQATVRASLGGTWPTGSHDPGAEREALARLNEAWRRQMAAPQSSEIAAEIVELEKAAAEHGDPRTFTRALAAMPVHHPEVLARDPLAGPVLTTIEEALPDVARMLVERREQQALRGLCRIWRQDLQQRLASYRANPAARLHTELLALQMPLTPAARMLERPQILAPSREQAMATWQASQHPSRTVHVLLGNLDLERTQSLLGEVFATTGLPEPQPHTVFVPRQLSAQRRSIVPGIAEPRLAISWVLPPVEDHRVQLVAARWLGGDDSGWLERRLRQQGRSQITLRCRAPWPATEAGRSLLLLDVHDPSDKPGLVEAVLAACQEAANRASGYGVLYAANMTLQRDWNSIAQNPRDLAAAIAEQAMLWPDQPIEVRAPRPVKAAPVRSLLQRTFAAQPAIVEGKR